jgi:hypothetical protein
MIKEINSYPTWAAIVIWANKLEAQLVLLKVKFSVLPLKYQPLLNIFKHFSGQSFFVNKKLKVS